MAHDHDLTSELWFFPGLRLHLVEPLPHCHQPLIEIDHYGERLIGCLEVQRMGRPGDTTLPMQLREDDLEALRARLR